jgi:tartrate-resistant acid phosphatase type 5
MSANGIQLLGSQVKTRSRPIHVAMNGRFDVHQHGSDVAFTMARDTTYRFGARNRTVVGRNRSLSVESLEERTLLSATRFAVIGDYGLAGQPEADVANLVKSWNPAFVISVGDNNYQTGSASTIDANVGQYYHDFISPYVGTYGAGSASNRFFPVLGDHDWGLTYPNPTGDQPFLNYFTLPGNERYYTFTQGPVQFFALDSNGNEPDGTTSTSTQGRWLQAQLAASTATYKIVYDFDPPYTSSTGFANVDSRWPYQAWGATAVISGHAHNYERLLEDNNFPYFVDGLGGEPEVIQFDSPVPGSQVRYNADFGAMLINADSTQIQFQFITRTGTVIDTYTIPASAPSGPPRVTPASTSANHQTVSGLVIMPATADGALVTNYLITNISGGTLFLNDGVTAVSSGSMITTAQGAVGLKFTPTTGSTASGSFTVQESPDANASDASGATTAATITVTPPTNSFVTALYLDVLNRAPDRGGLTSFTNLLANGASTSDIVTAFWQSAEHRGIEVDGYYKTLFNRAADPAGRQYWINSMLAGMNEEAVMVDFLNSPEFEQSNALAKPFVDALYQDLLGRPADTAGESFFVTALSSNAATPSQVIQSFVNSHERNLNLVDSFYRDFLQRPPDRPGEMYWVRQLDNGTIDDQFLAEFFLSSQEFINDNPLGAL